MIFKLTKILVLLVFYFLILKILNFLVPIVFKFMQQSPLLSSKTSALLICVLTQDTKSRDIKLLCYASLSFTWGIDFTPHTRKTVTKKKKRKENMIFSLEWIMKFITVEQVLYNDDLSLFRSDVGHKQIIDPTLTCL